MKEAVREHNPIDTPFAAECKESSALPFKQALAGASPASGANFSPGGETDITTVS